MKMVKKFKKYVSLFSCAVYLLTLLPAGRVYADGHEESLKKIGRVKEAIEFSKATGRRSIVTQASEESKKILAAIPSNQTGHPQIKDELEKLYRDLAHLDKAADLSKRLGECAGNARIEALALKTFLRESPSESPPSQEDPAIGPCGQTDQNQEVIDRINADLKKIYENPYYSWDMGNVDDQRDSVLRPFAQAMVDETITKMFESYWSYKGLFETPLPSNLQSAVEDVFGKKAKVSGDLLKRLGYQYHQTKEELTKLFKDAQSRAEKDEGPFPGSYKQMIQMNRAQKVADLQASIDRIQQWKSLPAVYRETVIDSVDGARRNKDRVFLPSRRGASALTTMLKNEHQKRPSWMRDPIFETSPQEAEDKLRTVIANGVRTLVSMNEDNVQSSLPKIDRMTEALLGRPFDREDLVQLVTNDVSKSPQEPNIFRSSSAPNLPFGNVALNERILRPDPVVRILHRDSKEFEQQFENAVYVETAQQPLLHTDSFKNLIFHLDRSMAAKAPQITDRHLTEALRDQQKTIKSQMEELLELKEERPLDIVKKLLKRNPASVWKQFYKHPPLLREVCGLYHEIKQEREGKEFTDKVFFWAGMGILAVMLAASGALVIAGPSLFFSAVIAGSGVTSSTLLAVGAGRGIYYAPDKKATYDLLRASVIANAGASVEEAEEALEEFDNEILNILLNTTFALADLHGLFYGIKTLRQLQGATAKLRAQLDRPIGNMGRTNETRSGETGILGETSDSDIPSDMIELFSSESRLLPKTESLPSRRIANPLLRETKTNHLFIEEGRGKLQIIESPSQPHMSEQRSAVPVKSVSSSGEEISGYLELADATDTLPHRARLVDSDGKPISSDTFEFRDGKWHSLTSDRVVEVEPDVIPHIHPEAIYKGTISPMDDVDYPFVDPSHPHETRRIVGVADSKVSFSNKYSGKITGKLDNDEIVIFEEGNWFREEEFLKPKEKRTSLIRGVEGKKGPISRHVGSDVSPIREGSSVKPIESKISEEIPTASAGDEISKENNIVVDQTAETERILFPKKTEMGGRYRLPDNSQTQTEPTAAVGQRTIKTEKIVIPEDDTVTIDYNSPLMSPEDLLDPPPSPSHPPMRPARLEGDPTKRGTRVTYPSQAHVDPNAETRVIDYSTFPKRDNP